jgi:hypothetical protein
MFRLSGRPQRTLRRIAAVLVAGLTTLLLVSPGGATTSAGSPTAGSSDAKEWCALVIKINTKYGTMKNKRYLPEGQVSARAWKRVIDAAVAERSHILAVSPKSIKKAMTHELDWFARVKANNYNRISTPLGSFTLADIKQLTNFQRTQCGITFST